MEGGPDNHRGGATSPVNKIFVPPDDGTVLVPTFSSTIPHQSLQIGATLAQANETGLLILCSVSLPPQTPLDIPNEEFTDELCLIEEMVTTVKTEFPEIATHGVLRVGRGHDQIIKRAVIEHGVCGVILEHQSPSGVLSTIHQSKIEQIARQLPCNVIVANGRGTFSSISSVLVPVSGSIHSGFAVDIGNCIATQNEAWLDIVHVLPEEASASQQARGERYLSAAIDRLTKAPRTNTWLLESDDTVTTLIEQSENYDLTILGESEKGHLRRFLFDSTTEEIYSESSQCVISVRTASIWTLEW